MLDERVVTILEQRPTDIKDHLRLLYNLVVDHGYRNVVELGAGQSTFIFSAAVQKTGGFVTSIDISKDALYRNNANVDEFLHEMTSVKFIVKDDLEAVYDVKDPIDFLFIDSNHLYQHVLSTLRLWAPRVRMGGRIALHDTDHSFGHAIGVLPALEMYLAETPGLYSVHHTKGCGGLSVLKKLGEK